MTSKQSVKVSELRKQEYTDFENWIEEKDNVYVGRSGRIWIHGKNKKIFHYKGSKWANPFKVNKECSLNDSLMKYMDYIVESGLIYDINELRVKHSVVGVQHQTVTQIFYARLPTVKYSMIFSTR